MGCAWGQITLLCGCWSCLVNCEKLALHCPRCFWGRPVWRQQKGYLPSLQFRFGSRILWCYQLVRMLPRYLGASPSLKKPTRETSRQVTSNLPNECWKARRWEDVVAQIPESLGQVIHPGRMAKGETPAESGEKGTWSWGYLRNSRTGERIIRTTRSGAN